MDDVCWGMVGVRLVWIRGFPGWTFDRIQQPPNIPIKLQSPSVLCTPILNLNGTFVGWTAQSLVAPADRSRVHLTTDKSETKMTRA